MTTFSFSILFYITVCIVFLSYFCFYEIKKFKKNQKITKKETKKIPNQKNTEDDIEKMLSSNRHAPMWVRLLFLIFLSFIITVTIWLSISLAHPIVYEATDYDTSLKTDWKSIIICISIAAILFLIIISFSNNSPYKIKKTKISEDDKKIKQAVATKPEHSNAKTYFGVSKKTSYALGAIIFGIILLIGNIWFMRNYISDKNEAVAPVQVQPVEILTNSNCPPLGGDPLLFDKVNTFSVGQVRRFRFGMDIRPHYTPRSEGLTTVTIFCLSDQIYTENYSYKEKITVKNGVVVDRSVSEAGKNYANDIYGISVNPSGDLEVKNYSRN